jgi:predicted amidohydrolase
VTAGGPGVLRVAAAQAESVPGDLAANVATAVASVRSAAERGAAVAVLPELFLTGYAPEAWRPELCLTLDEPELEPLREAARTHGVVVVVGAAVRRGLDPATCTLSVVVVDRRGEVTAPYDKQHLFADEREFFTPGDHGATVVVDGWELGLGVCYDGCFPEHAAAAAAGGATAYLCPSAYFTGSEHRRDLYYAARALDNGIYVVFAGLAGRCGPWEFNGGSAVYDPEGRPLARVGAEVPALAVADLDPGEVARVQAMNPIAADRLDSQGRRHRVVLGDATPVG